MSRPKSIIIKGCKEDKTAERQKLWDEFVEKYKPKPIATWEENGVTITKYEAR